MKSKIKNKKESIFIKMDKFWQKLQKFFSKNFSLRNLFYGAAIFALIMILIFAYKWKSFWLIVPIALLASGRIAEYLDILDKQSKKSTPPRSEDEVE